MEHISNWLKERRAAKKLEKIELDHVSDLVGDDWRRVWQKLRIEPRLAQNHAVIAEIAINGNPAFPFITTVGYCSRAEVILALKRNLYLTDAEASDLITCTLRREDALHRLEERLTLTDGTN